MLVMQPRWKQAIRTYVPFEVRFLLLALYHHRRLELHEAASLACISSTLR